MKSIFSSARGSCRPEWAKVGHMLLSQIQLIFAALFK